MKTFEDIVTDYVYKSVERQRELRQGQFMFNYFHEVEPDIANQITGTDSDCFYLDNRMPQFLDQFKKLYNQKYNLC